MKETRELLRQLYERTKYIDDRIADDGDGRTDTWQSTEFSDLLKRIKDHLSDKSQKIQAPQKRRSLDDWDGEQP